MYYHQSSTLPQYSQSAYPTAGCGACSLQGVGVGAVLASPAYAAYKLASNCSGCGGVGCSGVGCAAAQAGLGMDAAEAVGTGVGLALLAAGVALSGFLSYQIGKAMAPSGASKKNWAWTAVPVGMFTGTLGLGIMGWVANSKG